MEISTHRRAPPVTIPLARQYASPPSVAAGYASPPTVAAGYASPPPHVAARPCYMPQKRSLSDPQMSPAPKKVQVTTVVKGSYCGEDTGSYRGEGPYNFEDSDHDSEYSERTVSSTESEGDD
jgi:hypothetical protein